ncbi:MAG: hypothetical protein M3Z26_00600 [Bacteroidota bacterium]|nr:hypothetical protein [Bacteroidota bacterium]
MKKVNQDFAMTDNDLFIINGDIAIQESDINHIDDTINAFPGWWKNYLEDGVGISQYLNSIGSEQTIKKALIINLQSDGYIVNNPIIETDSSGQLKIIPNATI